ncbi:MAG: prolipoprotein diacylglyceryl transferase, partial [Bifidobacteriaceae bacterium]|nr:prolipoprotein diacylglyceryl transferase [Bifidobacteriaceae bacterium]
MFPALIPSPTHGVWHLGPLPIRAYALAIIVGIVAAWWIAARRYTARGGPENAMLDVTYWAVPFGIVGGRLYHVITTPEAYFGQGGQPLKALAIWEGGLGIWGAISLGALGAWIGCRRAGVRFAPIADALAPALLVAQGIGRLGNWFNQELFGSPTDLPWGLQVAPAVAEAAGYPAGTLFHPTFLYELLWDFAAVGLVLLAERRFRLGHGRVMAFYAAAYSLGRLFIEMLRIDQAHTIAGLRLNVWTSLLVLVLGLAAVVVIGRRHPGPDTEFYLPDRAPDPPEASDAESPGPESSDEADDGA